MNIIFVSLAYPKTSSESNLYSDLMEEFTLQGNKVYVVNPAEKRYGNKTRLLEEKGISVLHVKTGNITSNPNYIAKGIALLQFQSRFIRAIKQYLKGVQFDLILYSTPPIQYNRIIRFLKNYSEAKTYLLLKDIFPQNAVDMGLLAKWNPIYWYFKLKERQTYLLSDFIGCMSQANVEYLIQHNKYLQPHNIEVCANSLRNRGPVDNAEKNRIRKQIRDSFLINENDLLIIYGGNLGISQGIPFLLEIIHAYRLHDGIKFLIAGEGTWYSRIERYLSKGEYNNVILKKRVSPIEFRDMLFAADIGLIFLNPKFTIPNFPSRLTSYLEAGLPVIACTDKISDIGDIVENSGCGYKVLSGDINRFNNIISQIEQETSELNNMAENARLLFINNFTTEISYRSIISKLMNSIKSPGIQI